jgi:hypothetical protein
VNTVYLKFYGSILKKLKFRTQYTYSDYSTPVYNTEPDFSHDFRIRTSYSPFLWLITLLSYKYHRADRDDLLFHDEATEDVFENGERDTETHNLIGIISIAPWDKTSLTLSGGYFKNRIRQSLLFSQFISNGTFVVKESVLEDSVPYTDETVSFTAGAAHRINDRLEASTDVLYAYSRGKFSPSSDLSDGIGSFSKLKIRETGVSVKGRYEIHRGFGLESIFSYSDYDDRINDQNDGQFYRVIVALTKRWN